MRPPDLSSETIHASCVAIGADEASRRAVLIIGRSGAGKSDLAMRLIDRGAQLVADDYTLLRRQGQALLAYAPPNIAGRIELRGIGIVTLPHVEGVPVGVILEIDQPVPRLPDETPPCRRVAGIDVPMIAINPFEASAPIKAEQALLVFGLAR